MKQLLSNTWDEFKFELKMRLFFPSGIADLLREERQVLKLQDGIEKYAKLWNIYQKLANGYAIAAKYGDLKERYENKTMRDLYDDLYRLNRERWYGSQGKSELEGEAA